MALLAESESYTDKLGLDRKLAGVGSREEAKERVTTWRKDTSLLSHHINAQMDDCKYVTQHMCMCTYERQDRS